MARFHPPDDRLAGQAARGEADAFGQIYERHHQALYRYILSLVRDPEDARDVLQATMEKAFRAMPSQRKKGGLRAWLFRIAHNESLSLIGRRQPRIEAEQEALAAALAHPDPSAVAEDRERFQQLLRDLNGLPERQRGALVMRELSGLSYDEIAVALAISPRVARQTAYEARVALFQLGEGREMDCRRVRETISAGDRRRVRGRRVRGHLKACADCRAFEQALATRSADFSLLFPPLSAAAAAGVLHGVVGGGAAASATGGAGGVAPAGGESGARTAVIIVGAVSAMAAAAVTLALMSGDDQPAPPAEAPPSPPSAKAAKPSPKPSPPKPRAPSPPAPPASARVMIEGYGGSAAQVVVPLGGSGGGPVAGARAAGGGGGGGGLPLTGLDVLLLALAGGGLLALGFALRRLSPD